MDPKPKPETTYDYQAERVQFWADRLKVLNDKLEEYQRGIEEFSASGDDNSVSILRANVVSVEAQIQEVEEAAAIAGEGKLYIDALASSKAKRVRDVSNN